MSSPSLPSLPSSSLQRPPEAPPTSNPAHRPAARQRRQQRAPALLALVAALAAAPAAAAPAKFLGWHPSGAFSYRLQGDGRVMACRSDASDIPAGFPEGTTMGPGELCGALPAQVNGVAPLDYAKKDLKGAKVEKKNPFGLDVKLEEKDGTASVFVVDGPEKKEKLGEAPVSAPHKLGEVVWRGDGRAVAVTVVPAKGPADNSVVFIGEVDKLLVGGPAGKKVAEKLLAEGQKLYKKRDWSGAGKLFEDAITASPDFAPARYARAAAEAQGGVGRTAMIENLQWLKEHEKDAAARKLLAQAKEDPAFDAWVGEPEVREILGLPKVATMDVAARLLERKGLWTLQGATCKSPWITLSFKKGGQGTLTVAESCKGKKSKKSTPLTYAASSAGPWELVVKKPIAPVEGGPSVPAKSTLVLDEGYQQLKLQPEAGDPIGTFEPGDARIDDSTL